jgi:ABC-type branched-subunit amino acid transport system substrate-binding protein
MTQGASDARRSASQLAREEFETLLESSEPGVPFRFAVLSGYAALLQAAGEDGEARQQARAALDQGAFGADSADASAILAGLPPAPIEGLTRAWELRALSIATVLPTGGSPTFQGFARLISEGVEVAAATYPADRVPVSVDARDDRGDPTVAAGIVRELEAGDVLGAVGFLDEGGLGAAAEARAAGIPLVSPTARYATGDGVYALSGVDPEAAAVMARHAAAAGYRRVAMMHSRAAESQEQATAFEAALRELGVPLVGTFVYDASTTYFASQIQSVQEALRGEEIRALGLGPEDTLHVELLEPVALFLPVPRTSSCWPLRSRSSASTPWPFRS